MTVLQAHTTLETGAVITEVTGQALASRVIESGSGRQVIIRRLDLCVEARPR